MFINVRKKNTGDYISVNIMHIMYISDSINGNGSILTLSDGKGIVVEETPSEVIKKMEDVAHYWTDDAFVHALDIFFKRNSPFVQYKRDI